MKRSNKILPMGAFFILLCLLPSASAKMIWQDSSLSLLSGNHYEEQEIILAGNKIQTQSKARSVVTFEHASGHTWGSTFLFIDYLRSRSSGYDEAAIYGEALISFNIAQPGGFIKNIYFSPQWEFGRGDNGRDAAIPPGTYNKIPFPITNASKGNRFNNYLLGFGLDLDMPKASYFNITLSKHFNDDQLLDSRLPTPYTDASGNRIVGGRSREHNEQLTLAWRFDLKDGWLRFDGFIDILSGFDFKHKRGDKTKAHAGYIFMPQLKFDLGRLMGVAPKKFWIGGEWSYWKNKFGHQDWDENNLNFLLTWHF